MITSDQLVSMIPVNQMRPTHRNTPQDPSVRNMRISPHCWSIHMGSPSFPTCMVKKVEMNAITAGIITHLYDTLSMLSP